MGDTAGTVYAIGDTDAGVIKIGVTRSHVQERLRQLKTGCPHPLRVLAEIRFQRPYDVEGELHALLSPLRLQGEWFGTTDVDDRPNVMCTIIDIIGLVRDARPRAAGSMWLTAPTEIMRAAEQARVGKNTLLMRRAWSIWLMKAFGAEVPGAASLALRHLEMCSYIGGGGKPASPHPLLCNDWWENAWSEGLVTADHWGVRAAS